MNQIEHIIEPNRLWLVWRPGPSVAVRSRRMVAEIVKAPGEANATLRYLNGTPDYEHAKDEGFKGYPAFDATQHEHSTGVLDSFLRRLPPRKRDDFGKYLRQHRLPVVDKVPDMALLGYTNAKLPSDSFELYPDLVDAKPPLELVIEVAGFRHQGSITTDSIYIGDPVTLKAEPDNAHDPSAVMIFHSGAKVGYLPRAHAPAFLSWMRKGFSVNATIESINGKVDRPLVYLYVTVR